MTQQRWRWMMDWCKENRLHPAESNNWKDAQKAYIDKMSKIVSRKEPR